jgi:hypothetical protein
MGQVGVSQRSGLRFSRLINSLIVALPSPVRIVDEITYNCGLRV